MIYLKVATPVRMDADDADSSSVHASALVSRTSMGVDEEAHDGKDGD